MSVINSYTTKSGEKRYRVRYNKPDGKWTWKQGFRTKRGAQTWLDETTAQIVNGTFVPVSAGWCTIEELREAHRSAYELALSPGRRRTNQSVWTNHVQPRWGHVRLSGAAPVAIQAWLAELATAASPSVAQDALHVLSGILRLAVKAGLLASNPAEAVKPPRKEGRPRPCLTHEEVALLSECAGDHWGLLIEFLAYTGLRLGEASGLQVSDVDNRKIRVARSVDRSRAVPVTTPGKSGAVRTVFVPTIIATELSERISGSDGTEWVWRTPKGKPLRPDTFRNEVWKPALFRAQERTEQLRARQIAAGADAEGAVRAFPDVTPHDLRHTAASLAVSAGASIPALSRMLGHTDLRTTLTEYAHLFEEDMMAVTDAMQENYFASSKARAQRADHRNRRQ